jgi:hypothetical protein
MIMNKKNLFSLLPLVVMVMLTISLFSCGGDDDNSPNGGGSYGLVDGVHVNPQKLLALDVYKGENANSKIHFDMSYDAKGRLTDVIASVYRTYYNGKTQTENLKMLSIDYDLRFIEYYHKDDYIYNSTTKEYDLTPVYERAFFNLNSKGYIATLDNCELSYNNEGYLVGTKYTKTMWTFAYGENDVIKCMVEKLKTGNIDIYYTHYGAKNGDMYFSINHPEKFTELDAYPSTSDYRTASVLILYHAGLFGRISQQCVNLAGSSNKNAIIEQISDKDGSNLIIRCSFVFK